MNSLLSKDYYRSHFRAPTGEALPLSVILGLMQRSESDEDMTLGEAAEHDIGFLEARGLVHGAIRVTIHESDQLLDGEVEAGIPIPQWIEQSDISVDLRGVTGIVALESGRVFDALCGVGSWQTHGLLLATSFGLPRSSFRRFIRRVSQE